MSSDKEAINQRPRAGFLKNALTLASGNLVAHAVTLLLTPLITRIYPPMAFGAFSTIIAYAAIFIAVSSLRYNAAIMLPVEEADAHALTLLSFILVAIAAILLAFIVALGGALLAPLCGVADAPRLLFFIPILVLLGGGQQVFNFSFLRSGGFRRLAAAKVISSIGDRISTIMVGLYGLITPAGLLLGKVIGVVVSGLVFLYSGNVRGALTSLLNKEHRIRLRVVAKRYGSFPKYAGAALIQNADTQSPVILLGVFFSPAVVGIYALVRRVLGEPMQLFGESLSRSFFQRAAEEHRKGKSVAPLALNLLDYLLKIISLPMILFAIIAPDLFGLIFGQEWAKGGFYAQILMPVFLCRFVIRPMSVFFDILEKQKDRLKFSFVALMATCLSISVGGMLYGEITAIFLYSLTASIITLSRTFWLMWQTGVEKFVAIKIFLKNCCVAGLFSTPLLIMKYALGNSLWLLIAASLFLLLIYMVYLIKSDEYLRGKLKIKFLFCRLL